MNLSLCIIAVALAVIALATPFVICGLWMVAGKMSEIRDELRKR